jgi:hypothetical protein
MHMDICIHTSFFFCFLQVDKLREQLEPLRAGTPLVSTADLDALDAEWTKWRSEWIRRRKVFYKCVTPFGDVLTRPLTSLFLLMKKFLGARFRPVVST